VIQAKVLLIGYLFRIGHFPTALHEAHSASSLAVACGLHKIRTAQPIPAFMCRQSLWAASGRVIIWGVGVEQG
jgi:hypothetical protein